MSESKNKGGRPRTDRKTPVLIKLSREAVDLLGLERNKSAFLDAMIRGKVMKVRCPHCGKAITVKTEE